MHAGTVLLGPIHDGKQYILFVLGDVVNLASRIESSVAKPGTTCVGEAVVEHLPEDWKAASLGEFEVKGKAKKFSVFQVSR